MDPISTSVRVGDIHIACSIVGFGAPVVVLHGAIGLGSTYLRGLDPWADEFRLVHYDQRGSGQTPVGDVTKVSFAGGLDDLDGLRQALGFERISVVGHSAGAHLAALYAGRYADAVTSLVLLNAGPPLRPDLMQRFGATMASRRTADDDRARQEIEASEEFGRGEPEALERHQLNTFIPFFRDRATVDEVSLGFTSITAANVRQAPERMMGSLPALDPMTTYAAIQCPTLVVHGELDPIPEEWSRMLADTIPGSDFVLIPGGSHFPHIEDAEALREAVVPWLRQHSRVPAPN
jgi:proline iminopeptidase